MSTGPKVEFDGEETQLDLADQAGCMQFIRDQVIPGCIDNCQDLEGDALAFRKITKNDSIQQTLEKLEAGKARFQCLYSYGPHIHKLLSVVEIFKKMESNKTGEKALPRQWNKLSCFVSVQQGRNELLEKRTRVPILIVVIERPSSSSGESRDLPLKRFTQQ